jgi:hypothetical protein
MLEFQRLLYRYKAEDNRIIKLIKISIPMKKKILDELADQEIFPNDNKQAHDSIMGCPVVVSEEVPEDEIWIISPMGP